MGVQMTVEETMQAPPSEPTITSAHFGMSATVGEIAKALATAQGAIKNAPRSSVNPAFKRPGKEGSTYADLATIIDACREPLSAAGIARHQATIGGAGDTVGLRTTLLHGVSGEFIWSEIYCRPTQATPQGLGSALTYLRRYSLSAAIGVAQVEEDDDGNAASATSSTVAPGYAAAANGTSTQAIARAPQTPGPAVAPPQTQTSAEAAEHEARLAAGRKMIGELGWSPVEAVAWLSKVFLKTRLASLSLGESLLLVENLRAELQVKAARETAA